MSSNNNLILRVLNSPWTEYSPLDVKLMSKVEFTNVDYPFYKSLDNNFIYLKGEIIHEAENLDGTVTLKKINGNDISFDIGSSNGDATGPITVEGNLELQGTSPATTSQAIYGINVITGATESALATKLPSPTTGRHTIFVNNSDIPILVFPSDTGGEINGVVDGVAIIPNDGIAYTFYCIENPTPGAWTWTAPAIGNLSHSEISINHTNGAQSIEWNNGQQGVSNDTSPVSVGMAGDGSIMLDGSWNTNNFPVWVHKLKVYTNIKWDDIGPNQNDKIQVGFKQGYKSASNSTSHGVRATAVFQGTQASHHPDIQEVSSGVSGNNVGDLGTLYMEIPTTYNFPLYNIIGNQCVTTPIALGNEICQSNGFYTFEMVVNANVISKEYKFQWFIEYS